MSDPVKEKEEEQEGPVQFDVVEPDPVPELKPVKTEARYFVRVAGNNEIGGSTSEGDAEELGSIWLAAHPETSFEVVKRYVQTSDPNVEPEPEVKKEEKKETSTTSHTHTTPTNKK
jgi:hypothetical protein